MIKKKYLIPGIMLITIFLVMPYIYTPEGTPCALIYYKIGGKKSCIENSKCTPVYKRITKVPLGDGPGIDQPIIGCRGLSQEEQEQEQSHKQLCLETGGDWNRDVNRDTHSYSFHCPCANEPILTRGTARVFSPIKGCISYKTLCENENGVWEEAPGSKEIREIDTDNKQTCLAGTGNVRWDSEQKKCFLDWYRGGCFIDGHIYEFNYETGEKFLSYETLFK